MTPKRTKMGSLEEGVKNHSLLHWFVALHRDLAQIDRYTVYLCCSVFWMGGGVDDYFKMSKKVLGDGEENTEIKVGKHCYGTK